MANDFLARSVIDAARSLEQHKSTKRSTVLFLGARTGGLFRSRLFYNLLERSSPRSFHNLSIVEQFTECYWVLNQENFTKEDLDRILQVSFHNLPISDADRCLAELVKAAFFDVIISTNVDKKLEEAFAQAQMEQPRDFYVFQPQQGFIEEITHLETKSSCIIVKVCGDFVSQKYVLTRSDSYIEPHVGLRNFLVSHLQSNVLVLGYDPHWDRAIGSLFPDKGEPFWYINEEKHEQDLVFHALKKRKGQYIIGGEGSYERFLPSLYWHIQRSNERYQDPFDPQLSHQLDVTQPIQDLTALEISPFFPLSLEQNETSTSVLPIAEQEKKTKVCIFFSQKDEKHFQTLMTHFEPFEREGLIDVWNDTKINPGSRWREEMQDVLEATKVAILLVSASFLASSFIAENILPPLLQSEGAQGTTIIPVIIHACLFDNTLLAQFKVFNDPLRPLGTKKNGARERIWAELVRYVLNLVKNVD